MKTNHILPFLLFIIVLASCKKDDPVIPNEEELITTLIYTLTPDGGGNSVVLKFVDLDGDGGNPPIITSDPLASTTSYTGTVELLNELVSPPGNITEEVIEEGEAHQLFYNVSDTGLQIGFNDSDINGDPIGVETTVLTQQASVGTLTIVLRHFPKKPNDGTAEDAGGETDIQVTFDMIVQ